MQDYNELIPQLLELDEESIEAELGLQVQSTAKGLTLDSIDINATAKSAINPELLAAGKNFLKQLNSGLYDLMCNPLGSDPETEKVLDEVISQNYTKAAGILAPVLVSGLGLTPAIATLIATLVIKKIAKEGSEAICNPHSADI